MQGRYDRAGAALAFLRRHALEPTPRHYELALGYVDAPDGPLAREIEAIVDGGLRLTAQDAAVLADRYTCLASAPAVEAAQAQVLHQARRLETMTSEAHALTGGVGRELARMPTADSPFADLTVRLVERLARAEAEMATMASEIAELRAQVAARGAPAAGEADRRKDALTDLPSRSSGDALLPSLAAEPHGYTVALCKLDQLQAINDRHGRMVGDNVLRAMASTLKQACAGHEVVRWTGDEFLVIFRATPHARAVSVIEQARETMAARTLRLRGTGAPLGTLTFSAGLASARGGEPVETIRRAKALALEAIAGGGDRVRG